jgi:hypothetical protein
MSFLCTLLERRQMSAVMDAVRTQDNLPVMLKRVLTGEGPYELSIPHRFSSPEFVANPRNHCAPLLDVIGLEGRSSHKLMVFPLLRPFERHQFRTFGEFVALFIQLCEVIRIYLSPEVDGVKLVDSTGYPIYAREECSAPVRANIHFGGRL